MIGPALPPHIRSVDIDDVAVDDELVAVSLDLALVLAVGRIVLEQVGLGRASDKHREKVGGKRTMYSVSRKGSLTETTWTVPFFRDARRTRRPMRPKLLWCKNSASTIERASRMTTT